MNDTLFLKACRGERTARPPIWLMRQAGRYLPEYRELRKRHAMLEMITAPELAAEVTLQPLRRFPLDAAVIFADILNPLIGMGAELTFVEGSGPIITNELRSAAAVEQLVVPAPAESIGYTLEAIRLVNAELSGHKVPVVGFAGAPFTLSAYFIEGRPSKSFVATKRFMREEPRAWALLQEKLVEYISECLVAQAAAGAGALQLFDSSLGIVDQAAYDKQVAPYLQELLRRVKERSTAPIIFFAVNSAALFPRFAELGADVIGVDWRLNLTRANELLGGGFPLQGNLDPTLLCGDWAPVAAAAQHILAEGRELPGHVFNLGHGVLPETRLENVEQLVALVQNS